METSTQLLKCHWRVFSQHEFVLPLLSRHFKKIYLHPFVVVQIRKVDGPLRMSQTADFIPDGQGNVARQHPGFPLLAPHSSVFKQREGLKLSMIKSQKLRLFDENLTLHLRYPSVLQLGKRTYKHGFRRFQKFLICTNKQSVVLIGKFDQVLSVMTIHSWKSNNGHYLMNFLLQF